MDRLAKLLMPYCTSEAEAEIMADGLSKRGVIACPVSGIVTGKFESGSMFGTLTIDGESIEVYVGEIKTNLCCLGRDPVTQKIGGPYIKSRVITLIER